MKKALIKSHLAAGKNSKGKNLIKKTFPKLGVVKLIGSSAPVVQTYSLSPSTWTATNGPSTATTNNVTITSNLSNINLYISITNVGTGINGIFRVYKNNTLIYSLPEGSISSNANTTPFPNCCSITSGDQVKFDLRCLSGGGSTSLQIGIYQVVNSTQGPQLGSNFTLVTNC